MSSQSTSPSDSFSMKYEDAYHDDGGPSGSFHRRMELQHSGMGQAAVPGGSVLQQFPPPPAKKRAAGQRATLSCTECARRKTKCNKEVPCQGCLKRGKGHLCHVDPSGGASAKERDRDRSLSKREPSSSVVPSDNVPNGAQFSALNELEGVKSTVDVLRTRIADLEGLLTKAFATSSSYQNGTSTQAHTPVATTSAIPYDNSSFSSQHLLNSAQRSSQLEEDSDEMMREDLRGEEVEASVALEFLALGRHRAFGAGAVDQPIPLTGAHRLSYPSESNHNPSHSTPYGGPSSGLTPGDYAGSHHQHDPSAPPSDFIPSPSALYPTPEALEHAAPPRQQADALINYSIEWMSWHHGVLHAPTFRTELAEFWDWGDRRCEVTNPAWLALWFALLVVGVANLAQGRGEEFGISEEQRLTLAKRWFDCSLACLYRANFLQNHTLYAVQALAVLNVTCQDSSIENITPTLLATAISICQSMGMHRLDPDQVWEQQTAGLPHEVRVRKLIVRETKKRVFWALVTQDWFAVLNKNTYIVQPTQVLTPLPLNARDEDLLGGQLVNRPPSEYTNVSKLLLWIQIARCLQAGFEHYDKNPKPSYQFLLDIDKKLSNIISTCPEWLRHDGSSEGMPPCIDWIRTAFRISSTHKVLTLHRPFLARAFQDKRFESSRRRAISASRSILREAARYTDMRLWTIPYHISAAATVVLLALFQGIGSNVSQDEERNEVRNALASLERMVGTSNVANRGVSLIRSLLTEEGRLRDEKLAAAPRPPPPVANGAGNSQGQLLFVRGKKRELSSSVGDGREFTQAARRFSAELSPRSPSSQSPGPTTLPSPQFASSTTAQPGSQYGAPQPQLSRPFESTTIAITPPETNAPMYQFGLATSPAAISPEAMVPQEFLNVFLTNGFDPLDGAITNYGGFEFDDLDFGVGTGWSI